MATAHTVVFGSPCAAVTTRLPSLPYPFHFRGIHSQPGGQRSSGVAPEVEPADLLAQHCTECLQTNPLSQPLASHTQGEVLRGGGGRGVLGDLTF